MQKTDYLFKADDQFYDGVRVILLTYHFIPHLSLVVSCLNGTKSWSTTPEESKNAALFLRLGLLPSTLIRHEKTPRFFNNALQTVGI